MFFLLKLLRTEQAWEDVTFTEIPILLEKRGGNCIVVTVKKCAFSSQEGSLFAILKKNFLKFALWRKKNPDKYIFIFKKYSFFFFLHFYLIFIPILRKNLLLLADHWKFVFFLKQLTTLYCSGIVCSFISFLLLIRSHFKTVPISQTITTYTRCCPLVSAALGSWNFWRCSSSTTGCLAGWGLGCCCGTGGPSPARGDSCISPGMQALPAEENFAC